MFVVNYQPEIGNIETFGFFNTAVDAANWMKEDVEYSVEYGKKNGVDFVPETFDGGNKIVIPNHGTWQITPITPAMLQMK